MLVGYFLLILIHKRKRKLLTDYWLGSYITKHFREIQSSRSNKLQVAFDLVVNDNLGLMIRGGIEYGLGIFITGLDQESAAFRNGLRVSKTGRPQ